MSDLPSFDEIPEGAAGARDKRVYDQITIRGEGDPPQEVLDRALRYACPDCRVNIEIYRNDAGEWALEIAHDELCPWIRRFEAGEVDDGEVPY